MANGTKGKAVKPEGDKILYRCGNDRKKRIAAYCKDGLTLNRLMDVAVDRLLQYMDLNGGLKPYEWEKPKKRPPHLTKLLEEAPPENATEFQKMIYEDRFRDALMDDK